LPLKSRSEKKNEKSSKIKWSMHACPSLLVAQIFSATYCRGGKNLCNNTQDSCRKYLIENPQKKAD
jgi:hypothetical protein